MTRIKPPPWFEPTVCMVGALGSAYRVVVCQDLAYAPVGLFSLFMLALWWEETHPDPEG